MKTLQEPIYRNKDWLYQKYIVEGLSCEKIAKLHGVSDSTIQRWLGLLEISARSKTELLMDKNRRGAHMPSDSGILEKIKDLHYQGLTQRKICQIYGVSKSVMEKRYLKAGIKGDPSRKKKEFTAIHRATKLKDQLYDFYIKENKTTVEIGKELGISFSTVNRYLKILDIPLKISSEAASKRRGSLKISGVLAEILDGELLGDGYLIKPKKGNCNCYFGYGTARKDYLIWLAKTLRILGLNSRDNSVYESIGRGYSTNLSYWYQSHRFPELSDLHKRWYPDGKKKVPKNIELTPTVCRHWYIGDGSLNKSFPALYITLSTQSFTATEVDGLIKMLNEIGVGAKQGKHPNGAVIVMGKEAATAFLNYIGQCPKKIEHVYGYKWGTRRYSECYSMK